MKTNQNIPLPLLVLSTLLLAVSPQISSPTRAADLCLSSECSSNKLTLRWDGALGVELQQTTNLANPHWEYVPGTDGGSSYTLPMTNLMAWFRLLDTGLDADRDDLYDFWETNGWSIAIDTSGYCDPRIVEVRHVTSDPGLADTDGDDLDDFWEWIIGTDPRATDTDRDGLTDGEEWYRWMTSPASVDTDGDARGPNHNLPPSTTLFDGNELRLLHTSPTLDDTDGDGRTDYEEYDQPGRNLLVAEVPKLDVQLVDAVDIRLDVQYAEETGKTFQYGSELSESTTTTHSFYNENSMQASLTLGVQHTFGLFNSGLKLTAQASVGYGHVWSTTDETAKTAENSYSQYSTDSRIRTETAASGSMSGGIRLVNTGPITYTITDLGLTVRYWMPGGAGGTNGSFETLATLVPALGANGFTLAPGDSTPVLQVQATGLNASRVKEFMARPNSLHLEPAYYELENAQGLNFDYLEEITRWRTARVEIDYGDGRNEEYRVATNVERNEDGTYAGVAMGNVMSNILSIPFQTVPRQTLQPTNATNERVLYSARDVVTTSTTNGFWIVSWSGDGTPQVHPNFEDIILQAGDQVLLTFAKDEDGDGLFAAEEQHYRTDDSATADSDGDGLTDELEARIGWDVVLPTRTYHVYSDPAQADQDGDGLTDLQEFQMGTDPTKPDTDADGLADGVDPFPTFPAKVLRIKWDATGLNNGGSWVNALTNLQDALSLARDGWDTTGDPADDVAEIWVATGVYKPTTSTNDRSARFELVNNTALYGGFGGVETKLSQRNSNPLFNGTALSGDLLNNDASTYQENTNSFAENSLNVCYVPWNAGPGPLLDGFTITGGNSTNSFSGGGVWSYGPLQLKNSLFRANRGSGYGGAIFAWGNLLISDCLFLQNSAYLGGGIFSYARLLSLTNCLFIQNEADTSGGAVVNSGTLSIEDCEFSLNLAKREGGAINQFEAPARISRSRFLWNTAGTSGGGLIASAQNTNQTIEVLQSVFVGNVATTNAGGAVDTYTVSGYTTSLHILNSTFAQNSSKFGGGVNSSDLGATTWIENSILWGNTPTNVVATAGSQGRVRTSCLSEAAKYPAAGNINADPKFVNAGAGDVRLQSSSPCIDAGNNYIDYYPSVPGFQPLPDADLDGNWRVVDGKDDGTASVDMGAYEYQGQ